jgi:hypothetical protein
MSKGEDVSYNPLLPSYKVTFYNNNNNNNKKTTIIIIIIIAPKVKETLLT